MKTSKTPVLGLTKHIYENRILMCWYSITIGTKRVKFRSDAFVPKKVEEKLHKLHCTIGSRKVLLEECTKLLTPYTEVIAAEVNAYLKLSAIEQMRNTNFQTI
jgi:hypothetical protein